MVIRTGIDIIEVERIREAIQKLGDNFLHKIYTEAEIEYCNKSNTMKYQHFAARFAAKEAVIKAISEYINDSKDSLWKCIEIKNKECGKPEVNVENLLKKSAKTVDNLSLKMIDISISHIKEYAVASAVAIFEGES